jgi:hypothetical protein
MVGWGIFLIVLGAGSLLLPMVGFQFSLMELVDGYQPWAGIVVAVIGAILLFMGMTRRQPAAEVTSTPAQPGSSAEREEPPAQP